MRTPADRARHRRNIASSRRRQRNGTAILRLEVLIGDVALALLLSGTLTEDEAADRRHIEQKAALARRSLRVQERPQVRFIARAKG